MPRPVTLCSGQRAHLPLEELAQICQEFGFDGIELYCWGDHFEVPKALADDQCCAAKRPGIQVVNGFTGSSIWQLLYSFPCARRVFESRFSAGE
jgi:hypothetical protein